MGGGGGAFPAGLGGGGGAFPVGFGGGGGAFPFAGGGGGVLPAGLAGDAALGAYFAAGFFESAFGASVLAAGVGGGASVFFWGCLLALITVFSGRISVTTPAAIVFPPSLKANLAPFAIVSGKCNFPLIVTLSPGLAILVLSGNSISTEVSAVLKKSWGLYPLVKEFFRPPSSGVKQ